MSREKMKRRGQRVRELELERKRVFFIHSLLSLAPIFSTEFFLVFFQD